MSQPFRLRYANTIVGLFTIGVLVLIVVSGFYKFQQEFSTEPFYMDLSQQQVGNLYEDAEVYMLGRKIGKIKSLRYIGRTSKVRMFLEIDSDAAEDITDDTEVVFDRKFKVGAPILRMRRPSVVNDRSGDPGSNDDTPSLGDGKLKAAVASNRQKNSSGRTTHGFQTVSFPMDDNASTTGGGNAVTTVQNGRKLGGGIIDGRDEGVGGDVGTDPADDVPVGEGRRLDGFVDEEDQLDKLEEEVERVSNAIESIRNKMVPTLDQLQRTGKTVDESFGRDIPKTTKDIRDASGKLGNASEDFGRASRGLNRATQTLTPKAEALIEQLDRSVRQLKTRVDRLLDQEVRQTIVAINQTAEKATEASEKSGNAADQAAAAAIAVQQSTTQTNEQVDRTLRDLQQTSAEIRTLATETLKVVRVLQREANDLPGTTRRINDTAGDTQELVEQIQDHWLLRGSARGGVQSASPTGVR